ncbi:MAG: dockerin type I domain-containing protein [Eubacteriales bacterium]|nr:dockerin type I domain-containing protein [Eubacteriales bacterium]
MNVKSVEKNRKDLENITVTSEVAGEYNYDDKPISTSRTLGDVSVIWPDSFMSKVLKDHSSNKPSRGINRFISTMLHKFAKSTKKASAFRMLVLFLILAITLVQVGPLFGNLSSVSAETEINRWATVTGSGVNVRAEATSYSTKLETLAKNTRVYVTSKVTGQMTSLYGDQWYKIEYTKPEGIVISGYMVASLIQIDEDIPVDDPYFVEFQKLGFPSSYWSSLREMKIKYPNWKFTPVFIESKYDWETILNNQEVAGRSLIPSNWTDYLSSYYGLNKDSYNALKSYGSSSYNYIDDEWKTYDGSKWVMASRQTIAYYMDPRNWLNEYSIFMFEKIAYIPGLHTREGVKKLLSNTFMDGRESYQFQRYDASNSPVGGIETGTQIDFFMEAAERSNVSPYHLASRSKQEVGNRSPSVTGTYNDPYGTLDLRNLYNYYNIGATQTGINVRNGLEYALYGPGRKAEQTATDNKYLIPWNSPWRSIVGGALFIGCEYFDYKQDTLYFQKFDLINDEKYGVFWHQYMGNILAPFSEGKTNYNTYKSMNQLNGSFEFLIPVIAGIPEEPVSLPTDARNRNPWLKTLDVSGLAMNQAFDPAKTEYSITLNNEFATVDISATTINAKAKVEGAGAYPIMPGTNIFKITGISEAGDRREYTVSIIRKAEDGSVPSDVNLPQQEVPALNFSQQIVKVSNDQMTGLDPAKQLNQVQQFVANLGVTAGYQVQVFKNDGTPATETDLLGTGSVVRVSYDNLISKDYKIVIYGDVNGDGRITSVDLNQVFNHVLQTSSLEGVYGSAADIDKNTKISSADLNKIFNHVLQVSNISQE